jgi:polygalacturonase
MNAKPLITALIVLFLIQIAQGAGTTQATGPSPKGASPSSASPTTRVSGGAGPTTRPSVKESTDALQKAIDVCCANGGGTVQVGPGNYLIGSIELKSGVALELLRGAVVTGSGNPQDYPLIQVRYEGAMVQGHRALVYAENAHDVTILGPGILQGDNRIGNERNPRGPVMVEFVNCSNVLLDGFTDRYRRLWSVHLLFCHDVTVQNMTIRTQQPNGDGIDVDSSTNVLIQNCDINTGDDCISLKSGRGLSAVKEEKPTEKVLIRNCLFGGGFAGIGIGSEMSGGIGDVWIENCVFNNCRQNAIYIKGRLGRGGFFQNIAGTNLKESGRTRTFLGLNMRDAGIIGIDPVSGIDGAPALKNISFSNVTELRYVGRWDAHGAGQADGWHHACEYFRHVPTWNFAGQRRECFA